MQQKGDTSIYNAAAYKTLPDANAEDLIEKMPTVVIQDGKKVFKDDRGEISLGVFDLLNQNNSLTRQVTETYIEEVQTNVLQQYLMLSFKYDLRNFRIGS